MKKSWNTAILLLLVGLLMMSGTALFSFEPGNFDVFVFLAGFVVVLFTIIYMHNKFPDQIFYVVDDMKTGEPFVLIESAFSGSIMLGERVLYVRNVHNEKLLFIVDEDIINFDEESRKCYFMKNKKEELVSVKKDFFYQIRSNRQQGLSVS